MYLGHLLIPLFILGDSLRAAYLHESGRTEKCLIVLASAWLVGSLCALVLSRDRLRFLRRMSGPVAGLCASSLCLVVLELGVRVRNEYFNRTPLGFPPGSKNVFDLSRWHLTGESRTVTFTVNRLGLRGPMPPAGPPAGGHTYRIITIGGSTTECLALDDSQEWPHLLMQELNERQKESAVWVGNAGVSGLTAVDHLYCLHSRPVLSQTDALVFLIGANDCEAALEFDGASTQRALERRAQLFIDHAPVGVSVTGALIKRSWVFALARDGAINLGAWLSQRLHSPAPRRPYLDQTYARAAGPALPLPDLTLNLKEYADRVRALETECHARRLRCVFMTQPSLYRADLTPHEQHLLWEGKIERAGKTIGYATAGDLERAMDVFNQVLLQVCRDDRLECYDLATVIPKDTSAFYDDVHFNVGGARMVADFLAVRLLAVPPFSSGDSHAIVDSASHRHQREATAR